MPEQLDLYILVSFEEMKDERGHFSRTLFYLFFRLQLNCLEIDQFSGDYSVILQ